MFSLELEVEGAEKDILIAELWEQGSAGIVETDLPGRRCLLRAFFENEAETDSLLRRFGGRLERHAPRDWVAHSRDGWAPLAVGSRFYLVPEWLDDPAPSGRLRIDINPGLACGTGFHEATQLCIEALEKYQLPGMTVLDVGAGSGILSIASALLGAARSVACDVDPVAAGIAQANLRRAATGVLLFTGSVDAIRSRSCDLILANISAAAAKALAPELLRCLAPGGRCVASGFESWETPGVETAVESAGGAIRCKLAKGEWRALIFSSSLDRRS